MIPIKKETSSPSCRSTPADPLLKPRVHAPFQPKGDQITAIPACVGHLRDNETDGAIKSVCLRGATATGKTFVMAHVVDQIAPNRPTLVLVHDKTLAAQIARDLRSYLKDTHKVEAFISRYDLYIPETQRSEEFVLVNSDHDELRDRAIRALKDNDNVVIVATVACLYSIGKSAVALNPKGSRATAEGLDAFGKLLTEQLYYDEAADSSVDSGSIVRVCVKQGQWAWIPGEVHDSDIRRLVVWPPNEATPLQFDLDLNCRLVGFARVDRATDQDGARLTEYVLQARHACTMLPKAKCEVMLPARHIRYIFDYLDGPTETSLPICDGEEKKKSRSWLLVVDESHKTLPSLGGMSKGYTTRVNGMREAGHPPKYDKCPLTSGEFWERVPQALLVSATPGDEEIRRCPGRVVDMVVRPSGIVDPSIEILPKADQYEQIVKAVEECKARGEKALVCTISRASCEDLKDYLDKTGRCRADWIHGDLTVEERAEKLEMLQTGDVDVLIGCQLLREGLDLPMVSLVAILDADVGGFMRNDRSLIQMHGRAARNVHGRCIFFAEKHTSAMNRAIEEINRRRAKQMAFKAANGIVPKNATAGSASSSMSLHKVITENIADQRTGILEDSSNKNAPNLPLQDAADLCKKEEPTRPNKRKRPDSKTRNENTGTLDTRSGSKCRTAGASIGFPPEHSIQKLSNIFIKAK